MQEMLLCNSTEMKIHSAFLFAQQYMNISITQHYHRHEYEINFVLRNDDWREFHEATF